MIAALSWIPKGVSKCVPAVADPPSKDEIQEMIQSGLLNTSQDVDDDDEDMDAADTSTHTDELTQALAVADALGRAPRSTKKFDDITHGLKELNMDTYDAEDGLKELNMDDYDDEDDGVQLFSKALGDLYYPSNDADPYLKDKDEDDELEEIENLTIKPVDSVIVCARNEGEFSHLEVWIYEEAVDGDSNMYVHHDIVLSAYPLCTAWLDCPLKGGDTGNFIAVGSMEPSIEIWDLDVVDEVQPTVVLGGVVERKKKKKTKKRSIKYKEGSHTGAVLGLAWNKEYRNVLASASADKLVKIWDVATGECKTSLEHHSREVQAVAWNHHEPQVLLSGSFDRSVVMKDVRSKDGDRKWSVRGEVESLAWDPHNNHSFVVSLDDGTVQGFDVRDARDSTSELKPSFTLHAHNKAVTSVSYNPSVPNLLATGSEDKMVKLWDLTNNQPSCIASQNPKAGGVFSISFSGDNPSLLAIGGSKGTVEVWDTSSDAGVCKRFGNYSTKNVLKPESEGSKKL
ncbi:Transducin/WD40 repeat-like superfamily protein [Euphorbia peplus]|nr:Transducin/WD40 repeat-like superfamily protein [Euphorbia peplus]